jgi:hypothetical protein
MDAPWKEVGVSYMTPDELDPSISNTHLSYPSKSDIKNFPNLYKNKGPVCPPASEICFTFCFDDLVYLVLQKTKQRLDLCFPQHNFSALEAICKEHAIKIEKRAEHVPTRLFLGSGCKAWFETLDGVRLFDIELV